MCLSPGLLYKLSVANEHFYRRFALPKKSGGSRTILCPSRQMKAVQAWILRNILDKAEVHPAATAFCRGANTLRNASPHRHNRYFLCLDIEDFFPSIPYSKCTRYFEALGTTRTSITSCHTCAHAMVDCLKVPLHLRHSQTSYAVGLTGASAVLSAAEYCVYQIRR